MGAISQILAIRLLLLLAGVGAFILGYHAVDPIGVIVFGMFCGLVVIPLVWLDHTVRR